MESLRPIFSGLAGAILTAAVLSWAMRGGSDSAAAGDAVLRYGWRIRAVAIGCLGIELFIGYAALHASADQRLMAYGVAGTLLIGLLYFLLEVLFVRARVSKERLTVVSPWRGRRTIPWNSITEYDFSEMNSWHILHTRGFGKVRLSTYLQGVEKVESYLLAYSDIKKRYEDESTDTR